MMVRGKVGTARGMVWVVVDDGVVEVGVQGFMMSDVVEIGEVRAVGMRREASVRNCWGAACQ